MRCGDKRAKNDIADPPKTATQKRDVFRKQRLFLHFHVSIAGILNRLAAVVCLGLRIDIEKIAGWRNRFIGTYWHVTQTLYWGLKQHTMVQSLWIGRKLSIMEKLCISSFLQNGHTFHLYVYNDVEGVPDGTVLKDANELVSSSRIFKYKHYDSYAGFSNLFRYKLLYEKGGYWVDTDVVCLKPFCFERDHMFASVRSRKQPWDYLITRYIITSWFIKAPIGSKIMDYCYKAAAERDPEKLVWGETGPKLLRTAVRQFGMQEYISPHNSFFPIHAREWKQLIHHSFIADRKWERDLQSAYAIHLYHEMWRRNGIDKNATFHRDSIYERLKRCYLNRTAPMGKF